MVPTDKGLRIGPLHVPVDEEVEGIHLKLLQNPTPKHTFSECIRRFNANVPYSGLLYSTTQDVKPHTFTKQKTSKFIISGIIFRQQRETHNQRSAVSRAERRRSKDNI